MKLLLCVHGFPPEHVGGTELAARDLAEGLSRLGHEVVVLAGSCARPAEGGVDLHEERVEAADASYRLLRSTRPDLYFDHWHKSRSARVAAAFRELLARERPDVVHVLHWLRLSRDLVLHAAQAGLPAVVSLNDSWVSCPLVFRVLPETREVCERPLSGAHCIACAGRVPPRTPWVPMEAAFMALGERARGVGRELALARAVLVPTLAFGERQLRWLGGVEGVALAEVPPAAASPELAPRAIEPRGDGTLRLGAWGRLSELKGTDLLLEALHRLGPDSGVALVLAGREAPPGFVAELQRRFEGLPWSHAGPYEARELGDHPVTRVHAMVCATRAPESFGLVLEESRALGLPSVLPRAGAFAERAGPERGTLLFEPGSADDLAAALRRLRDEEALLGSLREAVPAPASPAEVLEAHLEHYERARSVGPPAEVPEREWYAERMHDFAEEEWDRRLAEHTAEELGVATAGGEEEAR